MPRSRRLASVCLSALAQFASGCAPGWFTRADALQKTDVAGAYAIAAEAQDRETSPQNYLASLMAAIYADRMGKYDLARKHLDFAVSDVGSNPLWVRAEAWRERASVEVSEAFAGFAKDQPSEDRFDPRAIIDRMDGLSDALRKADADMEMAIEIRHREGTRELERRYRLERAGYRRVADNIEGARDLFDIAASAGKDSESRKVQLLEAVMRRFAAMERSLTEMCQDCEERHRQDAAKSGG